MTPRVRFWLVSLFVLGSFTLIAVLLYRRVAQQVNLPLGLGRLAEPDLSVPSGFRIEVFAESLSGPRFIAFSPDGRLYVAERGAGRIVILVDSDQDGRADPPLVFAEDLGQPHSLAFHQGAWYVGVPEGILRLVDSDGDDRAEQVTAIIDDYPTGNHSTRTVLFLPDGRMLVSIGSSCNVCIETDPRRAAIVVYDDASDAGERVYAHGLRNAVGLTLHPVTGEVWVTNNGRDFLGDDLPPETVYILKDGADYGWPRCQSGRIEDPEFGFPGSCQGVEAPVLEMQAHSAPLGLVFYSGDQFPSAYRGGLFIAFHGSWNRSEPTGYKVVFVPMENGRPAGQLQEFVTGWLAENGETVTGRPVGLAVGPDGALYVSDDFGGRIYRIEYRPPGP